MALRHLLPSLLLAVLAPLSGPASAEPAYVAANVHLRAGPGPSYPVVTILQQGLFVEVQGCVSGYTWCDVSTGLDRGWVYAGYLRYPYQGADVPVLNYGAVIGIGIVGFILFDYWHDHYRDRPWYRDRDRWAHRPRAPVPPPRPPVMRAPAPVPPRHDARPPRPAVPARPAPGPRLPPPARADEAAPRAHPPARGEPDKRPRPQRPGDSRPPGQRISLAPLRYVAT